MGELGYGYKHENYEDALSVYLKIISDGYEAEIRLQQTLIISSVIVSKK